MVSEDRFNSIFDYSSAFKYHTATPPKPFNGSQYRSAFSYHSITIATDEASDHSKDENWVSSIVRKAVTFLLFILVIVSFPLSLWICVKKVHALERIVLMRLGKMQPVREPGLTFVLPLIDVWTRVDLRPQTFILDTSQLLTSDGAIVEVQSEVRYQVCDIVSYVTKLNRQEKALKDLSLCCLANVVSEKEQEDLEMNREHLCSILQHELNQASLNWGLEILSVCLFSVKVLKAADPVDALSTIMTALRAATGQGTDRATAVFPLVSGGSPPEKEAPVEEGKEGSVLDLLKKVLSTSPSEAKGVNGRFKLDVVGDATDTIYCCLENGRASIVEGDLEPDVSVVMSERNARDFLEHRLSPYDAYVGGKVKVSGDWRLLGPLTALLGGPAS